jgi:hypothetical protein
MKNKLAVCALAVLLQGCGENISSQIEGVRWASAKGNSNLQLRFINGELQACLEEPDKPGYKVLFNTWETKAKYKIENGQLITVYKDNETHYSNIKVEGEGASRVLVIIEGSNEKPKEFRYVIPASSNCPI